MITAGSIFDEPEHGDLRIVIGNVLTFDPDDPAANEDGHVITRGKLVEEFVPRVNAEGFPLCGGGEWHSLCPLVDYRELYA